MDTNVADHKSNQIQRHILQHVSRYRMTTLRVLGHLPELAEVGFRRLKQHVQTLKQGGQIAEAPLYQQRRYLHLQDHASDQPAGAHSELSKTRNYAMLAFCCLGENPRERLTTNDFRKHFPDLYRPGLPLNYYVDLEQDSARLGFMRVDTGGRGRWDRVIARARSDIQKHSSEPAFRELIEHDLFEVAILTALPQKAERIRKSLQDGDSRTGGLIRVSAIPDLLYLIAPPAD